MIDAQPEARPEAERTMQRREALRFGAFEWSIIAVFAVVIVGLLYLVWCRSAPFEPYTSFEYEAVPSEVCVGDTVRVKIDRAVSDEYPLEELRFVSYWRADNSKGSGAYGPARQGSESGTLPIRPTARAVERSPVLRSVPTVAGDWRLVNDLVVYGKVGPIERSQTIHIEADNVTRVREKDHPFCNDRSEQPGVVGRESEGGK